MTQYITQAVFNGTKQNYAVSGKTVDEVMKKLCCKKDLRPAFCFLFFSRKTGKMVDVRMN